MLRKFALEAAKTVSYTEHTSVPADLFAGERVAMTGTLASMTHREAADLIQQYQGHIVQTVTQSTTLLILGEEGWPLEPDGQPSVKLQQAQTLIQQGFPLRILSESEWLAVLGLENRDTRGGLYTPAMLCQTLNVSVHDIRRWERLGLIHARQHVHRLPYFDFAEVANVRRLSELLASGVSVDRLERTLRDLQSRYPGMRRPLEHLRLLAGNSSPELVFRNEQGHLLDPRTRQYLFPFGEETTPATPPSDEDPATISMTEGAGETSFPITAEQWHAESLRLAEAGDLEMAEFAIREAIRLGPTQAQLHFDLADLLYRCHRFPAAAERYSVAVELDDQFLEAWIQRGCVCLQINELFAARQAFETALQLHADLPDAYFHLAELASRLGDSGQAREYWEKSLSLDDRGPWADMARQRLESCS